MLSSTHPTHPYNRQQQITRFAHLPKGAVSDEELPGAVALQGRDAALL